MIWSDVESLVYPLLRPNVLHLSSNPRSYVQSVRYKIALEGATSANGELRKICSRTDL